MNPLMIEITNTVISAERGKYCGAASFAILSIPDG
jgi:hypothetical protein